MKKTWMYSLALAVGCMAPVAAQAGGQCSPAQARAAETNLDTIGSWRDLHLAFRHFGVCDDGAIGEGYSQAVALLLVEEWPKLSALNGMFQTDPAFRGFVLRHIDRQMSAAQHRELRRMAAEKCPKGAEATCRDISGALDQLTGHLRRPHKTKELEVPRP